MRNCLYYQKRPKKIKKVKKLTYKQYAEKCRFKFNVYDYPNEFNIELIEIHGWYDATNQNGVTRDHMVSISYGWKRDISPSIISHPANCNLMLYQQNLDKGWRSDFGYNELIHRIKKWNKKHG